MSTGKIVGLINVLGGSPSGGGNGGCVTSWNDLTDRPFYDESIILYNGYPEIVWGYAIIPDVVLRDGVSYIISRQDGDVDIVFGSGFVATKDSFDNVVIEYDNDGDGFRLEMGDDGKCYFFPNGSKWQEGREDGEEVYTSKYGLKIRYKYQEDAGVKTIDPKFLPASMRTYTITTTGTGGTHSMDISFDDLLALYEAGESPRIVISRYEDNSAEGIVNNAYRWEPIRVVANKSSIEFNYDDAGKNKYFIYFDDGTIADETQSS